MFQTGALLYSRYGSANFYFGLNPDTLTGLAPVGKGQYVGEYTGERAFSNVQQLWFCRVRVPVPDDDLVSMTTATLYVAETQVLDTPLDQYTPGGGSTRPDNTTPAPGSTPPASQPQPSGGAGNPPGGLGETLARGFDKFWGTLGQTKAQPQPAAAPANRLTAPAPQPVPIPTQAPSGFGWVWVGVAVAAVVLIGWLLVRE